MKEIFSYIEDLIGFATTNFSSDSSSQLKKGLGEEGRNVQIKELISLLHDNIVQNQHNEENLYSCIWKLVFFLKYKFGLDFQEFKKCIVHVASKSNSTAFYNVVIVTVIVILYFCM